MMSKKDKKKFLKEELQYLLQMSTAKSKEELLKTLIDDVFINTEMQYWHEQREEFEECAAYKQIIQTKINDVRDCLMNFYIATDEDLQLLEDLPDMAWSITYKAHQRMKQ